MPEGPELRLAANFINHVASKHLFSGKVVKSDLATKLCEVPFESETYSLKAESRGKELKVYLDPQKDETKQKEFQELPEQSESVKHLLFRFGMSGCFKLTSVTEIPKHAHLRFFTKDRENVLSFVDYRRFGTWIINGDWGSDRGPDSVVEYKDFRQNVLDNLENQAFNKPICETLLNQKFFNGIGNYLRAEILFRCNIPPFTQSRSVLEPLLTNVKKEEPDVLEPFTQSRSVLEPLLTNIKTEETDILEPFTQSRSVLEPLLTNVKTEEPDILELCHIVPKEVLSLGGGKGYDVEHDPEEEQAFNSWLQCYYKDGMQNLVDHNGRTIWFSGPPGPMKPSNSKSRGKVKRASKSDAKKEKPNEDHDYAPKKPKKTKKEETPKRPIKTEKAAKLTSNQNRRKTRASKD